MELGMIGLGKMGAFMTERLVEAGHGVVGYAPHPESVQRVVAVGASGRSRLRIWSISSHPRERCG